ncbi:MAG: AAA family ATPase [Lachnospiraceae bacterium]|nr:AAA family ATPase [Lachnospiraceae bacterium]
MQNESKVEKIDLMRLLDSSLRHIRYTWVFGLIMTLALAALGNIYSRKTYSPLYKVSASFVVNAASSKDALTYAHTNSETAKQLNETFPYILTSGALSKIVAADLGCEHLPASVHAEALGDVNLFRITATGSDPQACMDVLNSMIENYPEVAKYILGTTTLDLINISQVPTKPFNAPNYMGTMKKFALMGVVLYLAFIVFRSLMSRTVYNKEMLSKYISIPILGSIPQIGSGKKKKRSPIQIAKGAVSGQYREAMETLRVRIISKMEHRKWKTMYVTSSMAGEGKTTMACNLAVLMAQHGDKVLLVDADLRNPSVAKTLGLVREKGAPGTNEFLRGDFPVDKVLLKSEVPNLQVLPGGIAIDRVGDQFSNGRFEKMLSQYKDKVDYIIVDTPPCAMLDDTAMVAEHLEGGLLVVRKDYASIDAVIAGSELLGKTKAPLFACAMNFAAVKKY